MRAGTRAWWGGGGVGSLASGPAGRKMAAPERGGLSRVTQAGPLPVPPPHTLPVPGPDPRGQRNQGHLCHRSTRGPAQKAGYPGRLLSLLRDPDPGTGFRCASRRKSAGDPHPVGPLGMRSAPALVRRSPGFRRSSERRQEVGPGRTRRPGAPRLLGALRRLRAAWRCVI